MKYTRNTFATYFILGIVVRKGNGQFPKFFKWNEITNLVNHKRYFGVECQSYESSVQFLLDEADSAKYVWKMCVLQHTFYKMHASVTESNELNITLEHQHPTAANNSNSSLVANISSNNHLVNNIPPPADVTLTTTTTPGGGAIPSVDVNQQNLYKFTKVF